MVTKNLFCAIRTVSAHILHRIPISGNVRYEDIGPPITQLRPDQEQDEYDDEEDEVENELKRRQLDEDDKFSAGGMAGMLAGRRYANGLH
jgi:hypothetical protein